MILGRLPFRTPFKDEYQRQRMLDQIQKGLGSFHEREMSGLTTGKQNYLFSHSILFLFQTQICGKKEREKTQTMNGLAPPFCVSVLNSLTTQLLKGLTVINREM